MTLSQQPLDHCQRLADQLQALSVLAESLTIRLLELEERVLAQEQGPPQDEDAEFQQEFEIRLEDTDQRLMRIEALLHELERPAAPRHLQEVPRPAVQPGPHAASGEDRDDRDDEMFPEEGEQPFMDELIA